MSFGQAGRGPGAQLARWAALFVSAVLKPCGRFVPNWAMATFRPCLKTHRAEQVQKHVSAVSWRCVFPVRLDQPALREGRFEDPSPRFILIGRQGVLDTCPAMPSSVQSRVRESGKALRLSCKDPSPRFIPEGLGYHKSSHREREGCIQQTLFSEIS